MRARPAPAVIRWAEGVPRFSLSVVTLEEIGYGLGLRRSARLEVWLRDFTAEYCDVLPVTAAIARRCADLRAGLRNGGHTRPQVDMLIAATAAEHGLAVVTRNTRAFDGCGLRVINPFAA
ncbi:MAG: type II toxin-antitoxin system VapC family toxin [Myxococcales bacterium]|nr:type II toxin-antitoxin system VapC family toxin [Myxococcales bacterium]